MGTPTPHLYKQCQGGNKIDLILAYNSMLPIAWYRLKECSTRANKDNKEAQFLKKERLVERSGPGKIPPDIYCVFTAETEDMIFISGAFRVLPTAGFQGEKVLVSAGEEP